MTILKLTISWVVTWYNLWDDYFQIFINFAPDVIAACRKIKSLSICLSTAEEFGTLVGCFIWQNVALEYLSPLKTTIKVWPVVVDWNYHLNQFCGVCLVQLIRSYMIAFWSNLYLRVWIYFFNCLNESWPSHWTNSKFSNQFCIRRLNFIKLGSWSRSEHTSSWVKVSSSTGPVVSWLF